MKKKLIDLAFLLVLSLVIISTTEAWGQAPRRRPKPKPEPEEEPEAELNLKFIAFLVVIILIAYFCFTGVRPEYENFHRQLNYYQNQPSNYYDYNFNQ